MSDLWSDLRTSVVTPPLFLHPYQEEATAAVLRAHAEGQGAALLVQPTGTGKTVTFSEIVKTLDVPTLIMAHREELLTQARDKLLRQWPDADIGIIGAGLDERGHQITIGSVQSVVRPHRLAALVAQGIRLLVIDEAHHSSATTYQTVIEALRAGEPGGAFLLGVTATPGRADRKSLTAIYGAPVYTAQLADMITQEFLCDLRGMQIKTTTSLDGVKTQGDDFAPGALDAAINHVKRNRIIVESWLTHADGRQTVVFTASVAHAHDLAEMFQSAGVLAEAVDGATPRDERQRILADYARHELQVVCNCGILTEGFDDPATSCILLARPTQSQGLYIQMVGRGTRRADGKDHCLVIDVADVCSKHSLVMLPDILGLPDYDQQEEAEEDEDEDAPAGFSVRDALQQPLNVGGDVVTREIALLAPSLRWTLHRAPPELTLWELALAPDVALFVFPTGGAAPSSVADWCVAYGNPSRFRRGCGSEREYIEWVIDGGSDALLPSPSPKVPALDQAKAWAERKARTILEGKRAFVAPRASWRCVPASEKQIETLRKLGVPHDPATLTKGRASDWIDWKLFCRDWRTHSAAWKGH